MKATPYDDMVFGQGTVRADGRMMNKYLSVPGEDSERIAIEWDCSKLAARCRRKKVSAARLQQLHHDKGLTGPGRYVGATRTRAERVSVVAAMLNGKSELQSQRQASAGPQGERAKCPGRFH